MSMVITDNSPSAGYVAWTRVIVTFKGIDYSISNGSSNKKFIWWDFTNPNTLQESDTLPELTDDDCVFLLNKSGTHKLIPNATIYHSELFSGGLTPVGSIFDYAGDTAPEGYLLCDGSAISRVTYSNLFNICGVLYGVGDGLTTFNVPNCKGKVSVGYNSAETEFNALGKTGGEKTHVLTTTEMPAHTHTITTPAYITSESGSGYISVGVSEGGWSKTTSSSGGNGAHQNLQPYIVFNKIIKY